LVAGLIRAEDRFRLVPVCLAHPAKALDRDGCRTECNGRRAGRLHHALRLGGAVAVRNHAVSSAANRSR
jgi:hypothetical protein